MAIEDGVRTSEPFVNLSFEVKNTGKVSADEIAQIYVSPASDISPQTSNISPLKLQGFARVSLEPRQSKTVRVKLYTEQLGYYSREGKERRWNVLPGKYIVKIGASSTDIRLEDQLTLVGDSIHKPMREQYFSDITIE
jgi:beta-glucosidase